MVSLTRLSECSTSHLLRPCSCHLHLWILLLVSIQFTHTHMYKHPYMHTYTHSFKCSRDPHEPILCENLKKWLKKCDDDSETSNWIQCNTKECPKCHATIEKNGGCNHMVCSTCKAEFCWTCLGPWEPHGSSW